MTGPLYHEEDMVRYRNAAQEDKRAPDAASLKAEHDAFWATHPSREAYIDFYLDQARYDVPSHVSKTSEWVEYTREEGGYYWDENQTWMGPDGQPIQQSSVTGDKPVPQGQAVPMTDGSADDIYDEGYDDVIPPRPAVQAQKALLPATELEERRREEDSTPMGTVGAEGTKVGETVAQRPQHTLPPAKPELEDPEYDAGQPPSTGQSGKEKASDVKQEQGLQAPGPRSRVAESQPPLEDKAAERPSALTKETPAADPKALPPSASTTSGSVKDQMALAETGKGQMEMVDLPGSRALRDPRDPRGPRQQRRSVDMGGVVVGEIEESDDDTGDDGRVPLKALPPAEGAEGNELVSASDMAPRIKETPGGLKALPPAEAEASGSGRKEDSQDLVKSGVGVPVSYNDSKKQDEEGPDLGGVVLGEVEDEEEFLKGNQLAEKPSRPALPPADGSTSIGERERTSPIRNALPPATGTNQGEAEVSTELVQAGSTSGPLETYGSRKTSRPRSIDGGGFVLGEVSDSEDESAFSSQRSRGLPSVQDQNPKSGERDTPADAQLVNRAIENGKASPRQPVEVSDESGQKPLKRPTRLNKFQEHLDDEEYAIGQNTTAATARLRGVKEPQRQSTSSAFSLDAYMDSEPEPPNAPNAPNARSQASPRTETVPISNMPASPDLPESLRKHSNKSDRPPSPIATAPTAPTASNGAPALPPREEGAGREPVEVSPVSPLAPGLRARDSDVSPLTSPDVGQTRPSGRKGELLDTFHAKEKPHELMIDDERETAPIRTTRGRADESISERTSGGGRDNIPKRFEDITPPESPIAAQQQQHAPAAQNAKRGNDVPVGIDSPPDSATSAFEQEFTRQRQGQSRPDPSESEGGQQDQVPRRERERDEQGEWSVNDVERTDFSQRCRRRA